MLKAAIIVPPGLQQKRKYWQGNASTATHLLNSQDLVKKQKRSLKI
jgi:hypothetical protein